MLNKKSRIKNKKFRLSVFVVVFFIFGFLSFVLSAASPVRAAERTDRFVVGSTCFRKDECTSPTYKGLLGPKDPFCTKDSPLHSEGAIQRGFNYSCYTKPVPYKLQVPFLVPAFFGSAPNLEEYIAQLYKFLIAIAGVLAGIMIIWAGVKWLTSAGNPERIGDAKKKIAGASVGLILVLSSYLLLNTINPDLVRLRLPPVKLIRQVGEVKETKCKNNIKFPCGGKRTELLYSIQGQVPPAFYQPNDPTNGTYLCNKYPDDNPCGLAEASDCMGIACEQGECADIVEDRITPAAKALIARLSSGYGSAISTKRACFNRSFCNGCTIPILITLTGTQGSLTLEADRNLHLCASKACECVVSTKTENNIVNFLCIKQKGTGENCSANAECEEGRQCVPGAASPIVAAANPDLSGTCQFPRADTFACAEDSDCANGICGAITLTGFRRECTGGQGRSCGNNGRCADGLHCVDTGGRGGTCANGSANEPCCSDNHCTRSPNRDCQGEVSFYGGGACAWAGTCR